jgi:hypothetical protein
MLLPSRVEMGERAKDTAKAAAHNQVLKEQNRVIDNSDRQCGS